MDFGDGPVPQPKIFTTGNPPRIAVDFADTDNAASRHLDIGKGSTSGVSAVSAGGRTRVVVELMRESSYRSRIDGNSRSEERRVGKESVSTCRSRWSPEH